MSTVAAGRLTAPEKKTRTRHRAAKLLGFAVVLAVALYFVGSRVLPYYLHYNAADYLRHAPNHWAMRGWLLMHITGGTVALLVGPWQFWTGFRQRYARLHRWTGRLFLGGVAVGCVGAVRMATGTTFGWAWGTALMGMALAWATTASMAYYAILRRQIQIHKEWMVRAYVVTYAFVTFRLLNNYGPTSHLEPVNDRIVTMAWASWVFPLLITEVLLQLRRMRRGETSSAIVP